MKKLIAIICSMFFVMSTLATATKAEIGMGVTLNYAMLDVDGYELELTGDLEKTTASKSTDVVVPEIFLEAIGDNGLAVGLSYISTRALDKVTRTDSSPTADDEPGDAGDYTAKASISNVIMIYTDIPIGPVYAKLGFQRAQIKTEEVNPTQTTYPDKDVNGFTVGLGFKGDMPILIDDAYFKAEVTYTDYGEYKNVDSNGDHEVQADTEITSVKLSVGKTF